MDSMNNYIIVYVIQLVLLIIASLISTKLLLFFAVIFILGELKCIKLVVSDEYL